jgi:hypothetical protein
MTMDQLPYVDPKEWPTEEHIRVFEAYTREFNLHIDSLLGEPAQKLAIDWWNAGAPDRAAAERPSFPHGAFALHSREGTVGPDSKQALYVVCSCGRGYSFGHYADSERLLAWLVDHDAKIPCPHRPSMQVDGRCCDCGSNVRAIADTGVTVPTPEEF